MEVLLGVQNQFTQDTMLSYTSVEASGAQTQLATIDEALHANWEMPSLRADCMQSLPQAPKEEYAAIVVS